MQVDERGVDRGQPLDPVAILDHAPRVAQELSHTVGRHVIDGQAVYRLAAVSRWPRATGTHRGARGCGQVPLAGDVLRQEPSDPAEQEASRMAVLPDTAPVVVCRPRAAVPGHRQACVAAR